MGANGKMEMEKVPESGFKIEGLNIAGFDRGNLLANINLPFKVIFSLLKARKIIKEFPTRFCGGTGGFASGPALFIAARMGIPTFYPRAEILLGKPIFSMDKSKSWFHSLSRNGKIFPELKVHFLGNPIRENLITDLIDSDLAKRKIRFRKR